MRNDAYRWLDKASVEVNAVFNYCNEVSFNAIRPYVGVPKFLSGFDLCKLTSGATAGRKLLSERERGLTAKHAA